MNISQSSYAMTELRLKKLLRLYLAWPLRFSADPSEEAVLFHGWLKKHYAELSVVKTLNSDDVSVFLSVNPEVIEAATFLKPACGNANDSARQEKRVTTKTNVFAGIYECCADPSMIGCTFKGSVFDVTPNGIGIEVTEPIPNQSIISMTVATANTPITLYRMTGEVRWIRETGDCCRLGIKIFDIEEADRWRSEFDARFLSSSHVS